MEGLEELGVQRNVLLQLLCLFSRDCGALWLTLASRADGTSPLSAFQFGTWDFLVIVYRYCRIFYNIAVYCIFILFLLS